jgi:hypothetical protein
VSGVVSVYHETNGNAKALGLHDLTPEMITEEVCVFFRFTEGCH